METARISKGKIGPIPQAERKRLERIARKVDRLSDSDRQFFERFPYREFRVRISGQAEREEIEIANGRKMTDPGPGERFFTIVHRVAPGARSRVVTIMRADTETDLPDDQVQRLWRQVVEMHPQIKDMEAAMRRRATTW
jgi:hypothetical protein